MKKNLVTIQEASKFLNVSSKTLRRWEQAGKLVPERTSGGHRRYSMSKLLEFKKAKKRTKTPVRVVETTIGPSVFDAPTSLSPTPDHNPLGLMEDTVESEPVGAQFIEPTTVDVIATPPRKAKAIKFTKRAVAFTTATALVAVMFIFLSNSNLDNIKTQVAGFFKGGDANSELEEVLAANQSQVLADRSVLETMTFSINVPSIFRGASRFEQDITINGAILSDNDELVVDVPLLSLTGDGSVAGNLDIAGDLTVDGTTTVTTLVINEDTFTDLTGTGLEVADGALTVSLGTSIDSSEIENDSILAEDLQVTVAPTDGYILAYDASGAFTWVDSASLGAFTDNGTWITLNTPTDNVNIGGTLDLAKLAIEGDTDEIQLLVRGNVDQTSSLASFQDVLGNELLAIDGLGNLVTVGDVNATGVITGGSLTDGTALITGGAFTGVASIASNGLLLLDDVNLTTAVPVSLADTGIHEDLTQGIVDAINDIFAIATGDLGFSGYFSRVDGVIFPTVQLDDLALGGNDSSAPFYFDSSSNLLTLTNTTSGNSFIVNDEAGDTTPFVIDASGNVGIGTDTPAHKLHVDGGIVAQNIGGTYERSIGLFAGDYEGSIKYSGNALSITNSPDHLGTGGGDVYVRLKPYGTLDRTSTLSFGNKNTIDFYHTSADGNLYLRDDSNLELVTLTQGGFVGIGTTTPTSQLHVASTSTTFPTNGMGYFDWSPTSATSTTGDLFAINLGANGNVGNLFNIIDNGTSLFSVSEAKITNNLPTEFTAPGDVSIAYDIQFTNPTASFIKSYAAMYLEAGDSSSNYDLTLRTFGTGDVIADMGGNLQLASNDPAIVFNTSTAGDTDFWAGVIEDADGVDDDVFQIGDGSVPGTNPFITIDTSGNVGIGTANPDSRLHINSGSATTIATFNNDIAGAYTLALRGTSVRNFQLQGASSSFNYNLDLNNPGSGTFGLTVEGVTGIGTTAPGKQLEINSATGNNLRLTYNDPNGSAAYYADFTTSDTGDLTITTVDDLYFDDAQLTNPVALTDTATGLDTTAQAIIDAINEVYGISTSGGTALWTLTSNTLHPGTTTHDLALGGTDSSAPFFYDVSEQKLSLTNTTSNSALASFNWNPSSATTASGDLFSISIGANGSTTGNLFNILDNGTSLFSVSESKITANLPTEFTAAGDVSMAHDLIFTNQTASNIYSYGPLTIASGESFENNPLTLTTYGTGNLVANIGGDFKITSDDPSILFNPLTAGDTNFWAGVIEDADGVDDDKFQIGDGSVAGTNPFLTIDTSGNVGIGNTSPANRLSVVPGVDWDGIVLRESDNGADAVRLVSNSSQGLIDLLSNGTVYTKIRGGSSDPSYFIGGNVGFGTNTPNDRVEILSTSDAQLRLAYDTSNYSAFQVASDGGTTLSMLGTDADFNIDFSGATDGDFSVNTDDLFVDTSTGYVGIGTDAPQAGLHVADSAIWFNNGFGRLSNNGSGTNLYAYTGQYLSFSAGATERMRILPTGEVGIGTTAPTSQLHVASTSTTLPTNGMGYFNWNPSSATVATGDLFAINIGANGSTTGNLFNITDNGSSLFSVSEAKITNSLPTEFTAAGDVTFGYDILLANQTASYIKSNATLYLQAGESFESNDLVFQTYNNGDVTVYNGTTGTVANFAGDGTITFPSLSVAGIVLNDASGNLSTATDIGSAYITNNSILAEDLNVTDAPTDNYVLSFDEASGGFTWIQNAALASSKWTDEGAYIYLTETTDSITIGGTTELAKLAIDGDADEVQFLVQGNGTQTSNLAVFEQSDGTDVLNITNAGQLLSAVGSAAAPSFSFLGDADTGLYRSANDQVGIATGGSLRFTLDAAAFRGVAGNAALPGISFVGDTNTGIFNASADVLSFSTAGVERARFDADGHFVPGTADTYNLGSATAEWNSLYLGDNAGLYFGADQDWNLGFNTTNDALEFVVGGNTAFSLSSTKITSNLPTEFTAAGDVSIAYDLQFTNPTASYINSNGSLNLVAGESFASSNLVLSTYNNGEIALTNGTYGDLAVFGTNIVFTSPNDISFDDAQLTSAITLTDVATGLSSGDTGLVDAINAAYLAATNGGSAIWEVTSGVIHPGTLTDDFAVGGSTLADSSFGVDISTNNFYFGTNLDANPTFNFTATDGDTGTFGFNTNDAFYFSNANVGIGTTTPTQKLTIHDSNNLALNVYNSSSTVNSVLASYGARGWAGTISNHNFALGTNGSDIITLTTAGNVGIGTTGPDAKLDSLSTAGAQLRLSYSDGSVYTDFTTNSAGDLTIAPSGSDTNITGNLAVTNNSVTTANVLGVTSTSTSLSTGKLGYFNWNPGSATVATGDLFAINIGANGSTTGNLFNITDNGSSLFSVSETKVTANLPTEFTSAGDVGFAYDVIFTNQTAAAIQSNGPLTIEAGESFESNDLTLRTFNSGDVVAEMGGNLVLASADPAIVFDSLTASDTDFWMGVVEDAGSDDDDLFQIGDGSTVGTNAFLTIDTNGSVGIGVTPSGARLDLGAPTTSLAQINLTPSAGVDKDTPEAGDIWFNGTNLYFYDGTLQTDLLAAATNYWQRNSGVVSPAVAGDDFAVGGTTLADSSFGIDASSNTFSFGTNLDANPTLNFTATDGDTGTFGFNTSDGFYFSDAFVGIGTTAPAVALDIQSTGTTVARLRKSSDTARIELSDNDTNSYLVAKDGYVGLGGNNTLSANNLNINTTSGNVGIGSISPNDKLEVLSTTDAQLRLAYDTTNYAAFQTLSDGGTTLSMMGTDADFNIDFSGATDGDFSVNTDDLFVDTSTGRVGIGTISANQALHVYNGSGTVQTLIQSVGGFSQLGLNGTNGGQLMNLTGDLYVDNATANDIIFRPGSYTESMRLLATGEVGVGTTAPDAQLEINSATGDNLRLTYNDADGSAANFADFTMSSAGDLTIAPSGGNTTITGNLGLGDVSPSGAILDLGAATSSLAQINFTSSAGVDKDTPVAGDLWFNGTNLYFYDGSLQTDILASATNFWQRNSGVVSPAVGTDDLAIGGTDSSAPLFFDESAELLTLTNTTAGNSFVVNDEASDTTPFVIDADGRVGIGTASPGYLVDIQYAAGTGGAYFSIAENGVNPLMRVNDLSSGGTRAQLSLYREGTTAILLNTDGNSYFNGNGNLGIGTTGPDAKLESLATSGAQLRLTYTDGSVFTDFTTGSTGDLTIAPSGGDMLLTGNLLPTAAGTYNLGSATAEWSSLYLGDNTGIYFGLDQDWSLAFNNTEGALEFVNGGNTIMSLTGSKITNNVPTEFTAPGDVSIAYDLQFTNQTASYIRSNAALYIVAGESYESNDIALQTYNSGDVNISNATTGTIANFAGDGTVTIPGLSTDGLVTVTSGVLGSLASLDASYIADDSLDFAQFVDAMTLDASTDIAISGTNVFSLTNTGTGNSFVVNDEAGDASPFVIDASGRVGIGIVPTGFALDVNGVIRSNSTIAGQGLQVADTGALFWSTRTKITSPANGDLLVQNNAQSSTYLSLISGNLGIGTASADAKIESLSTAGAQLRLTYTDGSVYTDFTTDSSGDLNINPSGGDVIINGTNKLTFNAAGDASISRANSLFNIDGASVPISFQIGGAEKMRLSTDGYFGIGTTSPTALLNVGTTSTTLPTNGLGYFNWNPASATTVSQDLFNINIGANGSTTGNLFSITDNGSTLFAVSESKITSALPHEFTGAGDVTMGYDLEFTNQTASYIKSRAPLYIEAGEVFESNDLTLSTYNSGDIVLSNGTTGELAVFAGNGDIDLGTTASARNITIGNDEVGTAIALGGTVTLSSLTTDGFVTSTGGVLSSTDTIGAAYITDDSLDFAQFVDDMTLDADWNVDATASNFNINFDSNTLFVDTANNRVGIGTNTPNTLLDINSTSGNDQLRLSHGGIQIGSLTGHASGQYLQIFTSLHGLNMGSQNRVAIDSSAAGNSNILGITHMQESFVVDKPLIVLGNTNSTDGDFRITGGNVGIGTTGPDAKLESLTTSGAQLRLTYTDGSVFTDFTTDTNGDLTIAPSGAVTNITGDVNISGINGTDGIVIATAGTLSTSSTIGASLVTDDSLDYAQFADTMTLDADLVLNQDAYTWTQNFTGTGDAFTLNANSLTTGYAMNLSSSSIALTTGGLFSLDWSPASATTAAGDLFNINIGANGSTLGNLFSISDNGNDLFSVSESKITSNAPHAFTYAGDVAMGFDLAFTNQTSSKIKSNAPLTITSGEVFENNNLTFQTYGNGKIVAEPLGTGYFQVNSTNMNIDGSTAANLNVAGAYILTNDNDNISALIRNNNANITMANVGTAGAQADPGVLTVEANGGTTNAYNLITAYNSTTRSDTSAVFRVRADGTVYSEAAFNSSGADLAEYFAKEEVVVPGELVGLNPATGKARKYQNGDALLGAASSRPGFVGNRPEGKTENEIADEYALVGLTGQVEVKVSPTSDNINIGDYVGFSGVAGLAGKLNGSGSYVGRALETWTAADGSQTVNVLIQPGYLVASSEYQVASNTDTDNTDLTTDYLLLTTQSLEVTDTAKIEKLIATDLTVLGDTVLGDTTVAGSLTVGGMQIDGAQNSIDAIGTLEIQPMALGNIEIMGGKVTIDTDGNITATELTIEKLNVAGASAGNSVIPANTKKVFVETTAVTEDSLIFVTPKRAVAFPLSVTEKEVGAGFWVELPAVQSLETAFDWMIVDHIHNQ